MKIQKYNFTGSRPLFQEYSGPIKYWVDVQPDHIEIRISHLATISTVDAEGNITSEEKYIYKFWDVINLSEFQKRPGFADQTMWTRLNSEFQPPQQTETGDYYANQLSNSLLVDVFATTLPFKAGELNNHLTNYSDTLYNIFVPDSSADCTDFIVRLTVDSKYEDGFEFEGPGAEFIEDIGGQPAIELLSPITLSSVDATVQADSSVVINVTSDTFIDEIWLEQVYGSLNKTRVKLTNGQGTFTAFSTGLEAGEVIRVKAGHRKFTGLADITVPVV
jgi:hypothetical protein